jgi:hypothetical protein
MYKVIALTLVGLALVVSAYGEIVNYESCTKTLNERNGKKTFYFLGNKIIQPDSIYRFPIQ